MLTNTFRFKQFEVAQHKGAMKVNTDGVLLGAWAEVSEAKSILDIGTGTGVIALMLAQKNAEAIIDAVDIEEDSFLQAKENFEQSSWSKRLTAFQTSLQNYVAQKKYDVIVSNPPYFIDDFKTGNEKKNVAKHSTALTYEELLFGINRLLAVTGKVFLVIPVFNTERVQLIAAKESLYITKQTEVISMEGKPPYLALLQLERQKQSISKSQLLIQNATGDFTGEYRALTKEFYLKF